MSADSVNIALFTANNLRLHDNPILSFPGEYHPVYVEDRAMIREFSESFSHIEYFDSLLQDCLQDVQKSLEHQGICLTILRGSIDRSVVDFIRSSKYNKGMYMYNMYTSRGCKVLLTEKLV
jgi:deoxyribodipyrimidine photolyase